jgi:hypothetical protein
LELPHFIFYFIRPLNKELNWYGLTGNRTTLSSRELDENYVELGNVEADGVEPAAVDVPKQSCETETILMYEQ